MPPALASSSTPRQRLSDIHKRRFEVFVDLPPSPAHSTKNTPQSSFRTMPTTTKPFTSKVTPTSLKRKLEVSVDIPSSALRRATSNISSKASNSGSNSSVRRRQSQVFVDIPPSPLHRTSPSKLSRPTGSTFSLHRRRSQVFVEIPASPVSVARMKGTLTSGIKASPLSTKAFNFNTAAEPPLKKFKMSGLEKHSNLGIEPEAHTHGEFPNGHFHCHQCRRKLDNSLGLHCTIVYKKRCKTKYCKPCLRNRYGQDVDAIKRRPAIPSGIHASIESYQWMCPKCSDKCNCVRCRKAKGLPPTGKFAVPPPLVKPDTPTYTKMVGVFKTGGSSAGATSYDDMKLAQIEQRPRPRAPRVKKPIREPIWTAIPTELGRSEVENRLFLREFMLRFSPLMRVGVTYLEELDLFHTLSRQCAKALVHNLLDLIAADAEAEEARLIREMLKKFSGSGENPALVWARLKRLRDSLPDDVFVVPIPDPALRPSYAEDESDDETETPTQRSSLRIKTRRGATTASENDEEVLDLTNGVTHPLQLLPCIVALCECALQSPSVRAEIEEGTADARGENRTYYAAVRKENERWAKERTSLGWGDGGEEEEEKTTTKKGKAKEKDPEKDKAYKGALAKHKANLASLENAHLLELQGAAPRFGPLGRDSQGHVYYAASAYRRSNKRSKPKIPDEEDRTGLRKWGWFLTVWGRGGLARDNREECWWAFVAPAEIRQLARWLAAAEGVDGKDSVVEGPGGRVLNGAVDVKKTEADSDVFAQGPPTESQVKALVKNLNEYADLLEWRLGGGEAQA